MTTLALIAAACIWFAAGYITAELVRVVRRIAALDRAESTLADGDELLCINATEVAAIYYEKLDENNGGETQT